MSCGNKGDEGESGETWSSLMIVNADTGFQAVTVSKSDVDEYTVEDF